MSTSSNNGNNGSQGGSIPVGGVQGLKSLLSNAASSPSPLISPQSSLILAGGANQMVALGAAGDPLTHTAVNEVLSLHLLVDNSGSMAGQTAKGPQGNVLSGEEAVAVGQNGLLADLAKDPRSKEMTVAQWEFGSTSVLIHPALPLAQAKRLVAWQRGLVPLADQHAYRADGGSTRLFDSWGEVLTAAIANHHFIEEESPFPRPCVSVCLLITDGGENHYSEGTPAYDKRAAELAGVAADLLRSERFHLAFLGLDANFDPTAPDAATAIKNTYFWKIAKKLGFPDGCIGVDSNIVRAFARISSSMRHVSTGKIQPQGQNSTFFS